MLSKILLRLIKESLLPAVLIVATKIGAIVVLAQAFSVAWQIEAQSLIPSFVFDDQEVSLFINSYSNLLVYVVAIIGLAWVLTKAYKFHDTHITPSFLLQLLSWNLTGLLTDSEEIYHKGAVWVSYVWLVTILIGIHTLLGINYLWIFGFAVVSSLVATWYFVADVERELVATP